MTFETKENTGALFTNRKRENDKQPNYRGTVKISPGLAGKEIEVAAWLKKDRNDNTFMSLKFSEPYRKDDAQEEAQPAPKDDFSDVPF